MDGQNVPDEKTSLIWPQQAVLGVVEKATSEKVLAQFGAHCVQEEIGLTNSTQRKAAFFDAIAVMDTVVVWISGNDMKKGTRLEQNLRQACGSTARRLFALVNSTRKLSESTR